MPLHAASIDFVFKKGQSVGRLVVPANSIQIEENQFKERNGIQWLVFEPVPADVLDTISNHIDLDFYEYLQEYYDIDRESGLMSNADSLIAPQVRIFNQHSSV